MDVLYSGSDRRTTYKVSQWLDALYFEFILQKFQLFIYNGRLMKTIEKDLFLPEFSVSLLSLIYRDREEKVGDQKNIKRNSD